MLSAYVVVGAVVCRDASEESTLNRDSVLNSFSKKKKVNFKIHFKDRVFFIVKVTLCGYVGSFNIVQLFLVAEL